MRAAIIFFFLLLTASIGLALDKIYIVKLDYTEGNFTLEDIRVTEGFYRGKDFNENLEYKVRVISYKGSILWENKLDLGNIIYFSPPIEENDKPLLRGPIILKNVNITEALPYFNEANYIKLYYKDSEVFSIDISKFSNYCGNKICNAGENSNDCPNDCTRIEEKTTKDSFLWIIGIILILMIIIYIVYRRNR